MYKLKRPMMITNVEQVMTFVLEKVAISIFLKK